MSTIGTIAMVVGGIGAVVGMRQAKAGAAWGRPVAMVCALATLGLAIAGIVSQSGEGKSMLSQIRTYNVACGETLGRHMAESFNGSRILVLLPPVSESEASNVFDQSLLEGLQSGMGANLEIVDTVALKPSDNVLQKMDAMTADAGDADAGFMDFELMNYEAWFDSKHLSDLLDAHQGTFDILISTVGLPSDFVGSALSKKSDLPEIVVLNSPGYGLKNLLAEGVIDVVVAYKLNSAGWKESEEYPTSTAEAFDRRYLLVTPENVDEIAAANPGLF